jgi:hypothetical protein
MARLMNVTVTHSPAVGRPETQRGGHSSAEVKSRLLPDE